jgi:hypothetical protein
LARLPALFLFCAMVCNGQPSESPGGHLLVVNLREHSLLQVDPKSRKVVSTVAVGVSGHEIVLFADRHFACIPLYSDAVRLTVHALHRVLRVDHRSKT